MATHSQLNQLQHNFNDINELIANAVVEQLVAGGTGGKQTKQNLTSASINAATGYGKSGSFIVLILLVIIF